MSTQVSKIINEINPCSELFISVLLTQRQKDEPRICHCIVVISPAEISGLSIIHIYQGLLNKEKDIWK